MTDTCVTLIYFVSEVSFTYGKSHITTALFEGNKSVLLYLKLLFTRESAT